MFGSEVCGFSLWWIFPLIMIILFLFMMRGRMDSMMCGHGPHDGDGRKVSDSQAAIDLPGKRHASGEINKEEYEEKKRALSKQSSSRT